MTYPDYTLTADHFHVEGGQFLSVEAPSGFGKTTLLRGVLGLDAHEGEIELNGVSIEKKPVHLRNLGVVFQDHLLFSHLNAFDNATFGLKLRNQLNEKTTALARLGFEQLALSARMHAPIQELSGGERQRVALLRATLYRPDCLILDEPLKGLDASLSTSVLAYLRQFLLSHPVPVIWVSHQGEDPLNGVRIVGKEQPGRRHFEFHRS